MAGKRKITQDRKWQEEMMAFAWGNSEPGKTGVLPRKQAWCQRVYPGKVTKLPQVPNSGLQALT